MIDTQELPLKQFVDWCHHFQNSYNGSDSWFEASAINIDTYKPCPGYTSISWKSKGYSTVFDLLQVYTFDIIFSSSEQINTNHSKMKSRELNKFL